MSASLDTDSGYNLNLPVKHLTQRAPVFIGADASVAAAASTMQQAGIGSVLISGDLPGIITDRDLRGRVLAAGLGPDARVSQMMSRPVKFNRCQRADLRCFTTHAGAEHSPFSRGRWDKDYRRHQWHRSSAS